MKAHHKNNERIRMAKVNALEDLRPRQTLMPPALDRAFKDVR
jgi:hypothetical protein